MTQSIPSRGQAGAGVYRARKIPTAIASVGNAVLGTQPILARPVAEGSVQAPGHLSSPRAPNRTCRGKTREHREGGREGSCLLSAHGPSRVSASPLPRGISRAVWSCSRPRDGGLGVSAQPAHPERGPHAPSSRSATPLDVLVSLALESQHRDFCSLTHPSEHPMASSYRCS